MVGHSELHTYFTFVYLYQMEMFVCRGLFIRNRGAAFECLQFPERTLDSPFDNPPPHVTHILSLTLHASFVYLSLSQNI